MNLNATLVQIARTTNLAVDVIEARGLSAHNVYELQRDTVFELLGRRDSQVEREFTELCACVRELDEKLHDDAAVERDVDSLCADVDFSLWALLNGDAVACLDCRRLQGWRDVESVLQQPASRWWQRAGSCSRHDVRSAVVQDPWAA